MALWDKVLIGAEDADTTRLVSKQDVADSGRLFETRTVATISASGEVQRNPQVVCTSSQSHFVVAVDNRVSVLSDGCCELVCCMNLETYADCLSLSNDSELLLIGENSGTLHIFHISSQTKLWSLPLVNKTEPEGVAFKGAFFILNSGGALKVCALSCEEELFVFHNIDSKRIYEAAKSGELSENLSEIIKEVRKEQLCTVVEYPGFIPYYAYENALDEDYPIGLAGGGPVCTGMKDEEFVCGITVFNSDLPDQGIIKAYSTSNGRYIIALDTQHEILTLCAETLLLLSVWKNEVVNDFIFMETEDPKHLSGRDCRIGLLVESADSTSSEKSFQFQLCLFPSFVPIYKVPVSQYCWMAACKFNQDCIYVIQGDAPFSGSQFISSLQVKVISECSPEARLSNLLSKRKFLEAEEFANFHQLDHQIIYTMRTNCLLESLSSESLSSAEISKIISELQSVLSKVEDIAFIKSCLTVHLPFLCYMKDFLELCRNWLDNHKADEKQKEILVSKINQSLNRIFTYEVLSENNGFRLQWHEFISTDLFACFLQELKHGDVYCAFVLWHRHQGEIISSLNKESLEEMLFAISESTPSSALTPFLRNDFIPAALSSLPDAMDTIAVWLTKRVYLLEISEKSKWPGNGKEFLETFPSALESLQESFAKGRISFSTHLQLYSVHRESLDSQSPIGHCLELIKSLEELMLLKSLFGCQLSLSDYCREDKMLVVFLMLDRIKVNLLSSAIEKFIKAYIVENSMDLDICLSRYIKDVLQNSPWTWWHWEEAPWEEKLLKVVQHIEDASQWMDSVMAIAFRAPVPWSEGVKKLVETGTSLEHPKKELLKMQSRLVGLKQVLIKYDLRQFPINQDMQLAQVLVNFILKQGRNSALEDVLAVYKAYENMLDSDAYLTNLYFLLNNNKLEEMMNLLTSLPLDTSLTCCQRLLNYVTLNLQNRLSFEWAKPLVLSLAQAGAMLIRYLKSRGKFEDDSLQTAIASILKLQREFNMCVSLEDLASPAYCWEAIHRAMKSYFGEEVAAEKDADCVKSCDKKFTLHQIYRLGDILQLEREQVMASLVLKFLHSKMYDKAVELCRELVSLFPTEASSATLMKVVWHFYENFEEISRSVVSMAETIYKLICMSLTYCSSGDLSVYMPLWQHAMLLHGVCKLSTRETSMSPAVLSMSGAYRTWRLSPVYSDEGLWIEASQAKVLLRKPYIEFLDFAQRGTGSPCNVENILHAMDLAKDLVITLRQKGHEASALNVTLSTITSSVYFAAGNEQAKEYIMSQFGSDFSLILEEIVYSILHKAIDQRNPDMPFIVGILNLLPLEAILDSYKNLVEWCNTDIHRRLTFYSVATQFSVMHKELKMASEFEKIYERLMWLSEHIKSLSPPFASLGVAQLDYQDLRALIKEAIVNEQLELDAVVEYCRVFGLECEDIFVIYLKNLLMGSAVKELMHLETVPENKVCAVLQKAGNIISDFENHELILKTLKHILQDVNPYYYEILLFLHEKIVEISMEHKVAVSDSYRKGIALLKFLLVYKRVSAPTEFEVDQWFAANTCELPTLAQSRLPFHALMQGHLSKIINPEITVTTAPVWLSVCSLLKFPPDDVIIMAVKNTVTSYITQSRVSTSDQHVNFAPDFSLLSVLRELLQKIRNPEHAVACASWVTKRLPSGANKVLAAETAANIATQWASASGERKVSDVRKKMCCLHQQLSVELILHHNNLVDHDVLPMLHHPKQLVEHLVENCCVPATRSARVYSAVQQIAEIFDLDITDVYCMHLCNWLTQSPRHPSDDESFVSAGSAQLAAAFGDSDSKNMDKAICLLLGLPNNMMRNLFDGPLKKFSQRSLVNEARFFCCLVSAADPDTVASVCGYEYSRLWERLKFLMSAAELRSLHLPYSVEMFHDCEKAELVEKILTNHARSSKVLISCVKICLEFKIWNPNIWLVILQKLFEMLLVEDLQEVFLSPAGSLPNIWSSSVFIRAWTFLISSFFEKGYDSTENKETIKGIYISLLRCPCSAFLDVGSLKEMFQSSRLLPEDIFGNYHSPLTVCSIISVLHQVISGEMCKRVKGKREEELEEEQEASVRPLQAMNIRPLAEGEYFYLPEIN